MKLNIPSAATVILSLLAGLLVVLSSISLGFSAPVKEGVLLALIFLSAEGISPLTGESFRSALHLPPWATKLIGAALAVAAVGLTQITGLSTAAHAIIEAALVITAGLGFAPTIVNVPDRLASATARAGVGASTLVIVALSGIAVGALLILA